MSDLTPEALAEWREEAEAWRSGDPDYPSVNNYRILALLDALAAEKAASSRMAESARKLFVETRDLRIRAEQAEERVKYYLDSEIPALRDALQQEVHEHAITKVHRDRAEKRAVRLRNALNDAFRALREVDNE